MGIAKILLFLPALGCPGTPEEPDYPKLVLPGELPVTDGQSTYFWLTTDPPPTREWAGDFDYHLAGSKITIEPPQFNLSPSAPQQRIAVTAISDTDATNDRFPVYATIYGDLSWTFDVRCVDVDAQQVIASEWLVDLEPGGTATIDVRFTRPLTTSEAVSIQAQDVDIVSITPSTLQFDVANYSTPQTVTLRGNVTGITRIGLYSSYPSSGHVRVAVN